MSYGNEKNIVVAICEAFVKSIIYGFLPFIFFIVISSRVSYFGGIRSFVVLTGSMNPTIPVGTIVLTHPFAAYGQNDIITFKRDGKVVTHRIVESQLKADSRYYTTRGDANNVEDSDLVANSDVIGKVFFAIPYIGQTLFFMRTIPGYLIIVVLPSLLFVIFELIEIKKELDREHECKLPVVH